MSKIKQPNLEGRAARCIYYGSSKRNGGVCRSEVPSNTDLPFFIHKPDKKYDEYYCGCWGWG